MADARITVKIEGLDKLLEFVEQLKQVEVNVEKMAQAVASAQRSITVHEAHDAAGVAREIARLQQDEW